MIAANHIAKAETTINASAGKVWDALTDPGMIKKYMFESTVISDWKEGSKIIWKGEWEGRTYEDKGKILRFEPKKVCNTVTLARFQNWKKTGELSYSNN